MDDLERKFQEALESFDVQVIKDCVDNDIDVNEAHVERGYTPLMVAAHEYDLDAVRHFLSLGADVDRHDSEGQTVIQYLFANYDNAYYHQITQARHGRAFNASETVTPNKELVLMDIIQEILAHAPDLTLKNQHGYAAYDSLKNNFEIPSKIRRKVHPLLDAYMENRLLNQEIHGDGCGNQIAF